MVIWASGNCVGHINEVTLHWCVTRLSGQLSLLTSLGWEMSTSQGAVAVLCGWEGNCRLYATDSVVYARTGSVAYVRENTLPALL